ncbi:MAG: X2-like carbohydrate binding domain-containing protein [Lachnospiraceae bacterium]
MNMKKSVCIVVGVFALMTAVISTDVHAEEVQTVEGGEKKQQIAEPTMSSIALSETEETFFVGPRGEHGDMSGQIIITATYSDGSTKELNKSDVTAVSKDNKIADIFWQGIWGKPNSPLKLGVNAVDKVGSTIITVTAKETNCSATISVTTKPRPIDSNVKGSIWAAIGDIQDQAYTGNAITPKLSIHTVINPEFPQYTIYFEENLDYELSYATNINAGIATVTIKGIGNFTGELTKTFKITQTYPVTNGGNQVIINNDIEPSCKVEVAITEFEDVWVDGVKLTKDVDYTVKQGSTIIIFSKAYMAKLSNGEHDVKIGFKNGIASTSLIKNVPQKGDTTYKILSFENQTIDSNDKQPVIKIDADFSKFKNIWINENLLVRDVDYKAESGSTIITLTKDYVAKLANGTHNIRISFSDGVVETTITKNISVATPDKPNTPNDTKTQTIKPVTSPKTGDTNGFVLLTTILLLSGGCVIFTWRKKKNI